MGSEPKREWRHIGGSVTIEPDSTAEQRHEEFLAYAKRNLAGMVETCRRALLDVETSPAISEEELTH